MFRGASQPVKSNKPIPTVRVTRFLIVIPLTTPFAEPVLTHWTVLRLGESSAATGSLNRFLGQKNRASGKVQTGAELCVAGEGGPARLSVVKSTGRAARGFQAGAQQECRLPILKLDLGRLVATAGWLRRRPMH